MSKAEDLSRRYVLPFLDKQYEKYGEHKQMELTRFDGYDIMSAYEEGYHQAEKDLGLSWKDIETIGKLRLNVALEFRRKELESPISNPLNFTEEEYCQEVLKRFKEKKGK